MALRFFASDKTERPAIDSIVLTGVLVATAFAVVGTASTGASINTVASGHGLDQMARAETICQGGIEAVQQDEDQRVANAIAKGDVSQSLDLTAYTDAYIKPKDDEELLGQYYRALYSGSLERPESRQKTIARAVECELKNRGFL